MRVYITPTIITVKPPVFFFRNGIIDIIKIPEIKNSNFKLISVLWDSLEEWSIITKNCDLGIFELKKFGNPKWIYVGKPFSQCVLSPSAISKLPELFYEAGLLPKSDYLNTEFREILLQHGRKILLLKDSVLELFKKNDLNELGQSVIDIVKREYNKWTGEEHQLVLKEGTEKKIRKNTVVPIKMQFKINEDSEIDFSYRINYTTEPPIDLRMNEFDDIYENEKMVKNIKKIIRRNF